jgi:tRNA/tmRNA/rRNA uracil-C5-methylase (TrmA/RlmC/RlmD family)
MNESVNSANEFFKCQKVPSFEVIYGKIHGWRVRAKLAVRQLGSTLVIGLFQEGTHEIVPLLNCPDHHPAINKALEKLAEFFSHEKISGYHEKSHAGDVRYLQCVVERRTQRVQATIVINGPYTAYWEKSLKRLYEKEPAFWHSLWVNVQDKPTNTIFGKQWHMCAGDRLLWESICGYEVPFLPSHFGQANLEMFERLLQDLLTIFPRNERVVELFSGIGIISLVLRPISLSLLLYEQESTAQDTFLELKERLPYPLQQGFDFIVGDANAAHGACEASSAVIVDPPRKGVAKELLETITKRENVRYLAYISCCWQTFERDAKMLLNGGFKIVWAKSYKFFPGTDHLETLCLFFR